LIDDRVHGLALLIPGRRADPNDTVFLENVGVNVQTLRDGRRNFLSGGHRK